MSPAVHRGQLLLLFLIEKSYWFGIHLNMMENPQLYFIESIVKKQVSISAFRQEDCSYEVSLIATDLLLVENSNFTITIMLCLSIKWNFTFYFALLQFTLMKWGTFAPKIYRLFVRYLFIWALTSGLIREKIFIYIEPSDSCVNNIIKFIEYCHCY